LKKQYKFKVRKMTFIVTNIIQLSELIKRI